MPEHAPSQLKNLDRILLTEQQIKTRLQALATEINSAYQGREITAIAIINGAVIFIADLIRHLNIPLRLDCIRVSSYRDATSAQQAPEIIDRIRLDIEGADVLLLDDILDTGNTLAEVSKVLRSLRPASLKTCVLLDKKARRSTEFEADFVGFEIPDEFVVGYGLDFAERYRQLPCIGVLKSEHQTISPTT